MQEKKGFTLIELLAVIVILAVIAIIAVPIIRGLIDNARKGAAEASTYSYISAVKQNIALGYISPEKWIKIPDDNDLTSGNDDDDAILANILVNGTNPDYITMQFSNQKLISGGFCVNGFNIEYDGIKVSQSETNYCQFAGIKSVTIDNAPSQMYESDTLQLDITTDPADLTPIYISSDETIATISATGLITAIKEGTTTITARIGIKKAEFTLTVQKLSLTITNAITISFEGNTEQLNIAVEPADLTPTYTSSDETIATISATGLITAIKEGTTTITVRAATKVEEFILTVMKSNDSLVGKVQAGNFANDSIQTIVVNGATYTAHVYTYNGDQTWSGNMTFGVASDVGSSSTNAANMVVVKVTGNLTINSGVTVTTYSNAYGGPKGFLLYVSGTLTNNGTISMSGKGAKAAGQNVYLWKNESGTYEYVPSAGANGATAVSVSGTGHALVGNTGVAGTTRKTGGGGGGGLGVQNSQTLTTSSTGGAGTSYAGGGGGGGTARHSNSCAPTPNNATSIGGSSGSICDGSYSVYGCAVGGGAGTPTGPGAKSATGVSGSNGNTGAGGLLIVYANEISLSATTKFISEGQSGGNSVGGGGTGNAGSGSAGGGGSGGGTVNIFAKTIVNNGAPSFSSIYNVAGGSGGVATGGSFNGNGGVGGAGSFAIGIVTTGTYASFSF